MQETKETWVWSLGQEDSLDQEMASHSSILAWKVPWTEKPGRLHPMGSQGVDHIIEHDDMETTEHEALNWVRLHQRKRKNLTFCILL